MQVRNLRRDCFIGLPSNISFSLAAWCKNVELQNKWIKRCRCRKNLKACRLYKFLWPGRSQNATKQQSSNLAGLACPPLCYSSLTLCRSLEVNFSFILKRAKAKPRKLVPDQVSFDPFLHFHIFPLQNNNSWKSFWRLWLMATGISVVKMGWAKCLSFWSVPQCLSFWIYKLICQIQIKF